MEPKYFISGAQYQRLLVRLETIEELVTTTRYEMEENVVIAKNADQTVLFSILERLLSTADPLYVTPDKDWCVCNACKRGWNRGNKEEHTHDCPVKQAKDLFNDLLS